MTLKELMGDATRGDGRRFANESFAGWFEPIFLANELWHGMFSDFSASRRSQDSGGWKAYAEPKKKVEMWKWACKGSSGMWSETINYSPTSPGVDYLKIEGSRIEVEE